MSKRVDLASVEEVAESIYGDGAWEIMAQLRSEVSKKDNRKERALNSIALAGNAASTVAGPAAIYSAVRSARTNQGGIPRDLATGVGDKLRSSQNRRLKATGVGIKRKVNALNYGKGPRGKMTRAAAAAGGTMVALQGINVGTDALSTKLLADKNKKNVSKAVGALKPLQPLKPKLPQPPKPARVLKPVTPAKPQVPKPPSPGGVRKSDEFTVTAELTEISKSDDKRQVFGWASITEVNGEPVVDLQNDIVTIEEIEKAAYAYVHSSRKGGDMHQREADGVIHKSDLIESIVVTPEKKKLLGMSDSTPTGWWVGFQVNDDDLWQLVKDGKRPQFSIHGSGQRIEKEL